MAKRSIRERLLNILPFFTPPGQRQPEPAPETRARRTEVKDRQVLINNVKVAPIRRETQDIAKWRNAIQQAEGYSQNRLNLYDLYHDILLDGYLRACLKKRTDQVTNRRVVFVTPEGEQVEDLDRLTSSSYFEKLLEEILNAKFWGHSLLEIYWPAPGDEQKGETLLIPRANVKPRWGVVTENPYDLEGIEYRRPPFDQRTIEIGGPEDLGILAAVAQYVIYKRGDFGDWAEYAEIFGIPFRWATYNNEQSRQVLEQALETAGSAGYVVAPEDATLQFLNANNTGQGQEVFRTLRMACNEEIGLAVLGNTMTTLEARQSGYAQSKTHAQTESELSASDRRFVLRILNEELRPMLARLGYPVAEGEFQFSEQPMTLQQRIDIDLKVASQVPIAPGYWYSTYGIPMPDPDELPDEEPEDDPNLEDEENDDDETDAPGKINARAGSGGRTRAERIAQLYADHETECPHCVGFSDQVPEVKFRRIPRKLEDAIADAVRRGKLTPQDISPDLHRQYYSRMRAAARAGFTRSLSPRDDWADFDLTQSLKRNISAFAAAKHQAVIEELAAQRSLPRAAYDRAARKILTRHNYAYLRTELITLELSAHTAGMWRQYQENSDLYPNLQYTTAGDDRVRPVHRQLDGATYPVDDPFWNNHTPPIDWRCRCTLIQTDDPPAIRAPAPQRRGFGNPARTGRLVQEDHPYFDLPDEQFSRLMAIAETLRADIELKGTRKRARAQTREALDVPQLGRLEMTPEDMDELMDAAGDGPAIRNALLAELGLTLQNLTRRVPDDPLAYEVLVADEIYRLEFVETPVGFRLENIYLL